MLADTVFADPWRFEANPEVYVLVAFLAGAYIYMVRVLGPRAVPAGQPVVQRKHVVAFVASMLLLFVASTWPVHQIAEGYLYSVHMLQHMMLSYFMPPLVLIATPEWMLRILVGEGRFYGFVRAMTRPVVAGVVFNTIVIITHIPMLVNASAENPYLHYTLHFLLVMASLLMWMPVLGPFKELQMSQGAKPIYLFLQSVIPTVPAGWLVAAEGVVYRHYTSPVRVWGISPTDDQQFAGAIMKVGGSMFLWTMVIWYFFKRFDPGWSQEARLRRRTRAEVEAELAAKEQALTYDEVAKVFDSTTAPTEERTP
jgi:putative membrane protein